MVYDAATRDAESDHQVEEIFEDEESVALREAAKTKWAALEKLVGAKPRIKEVAADLVKHFEARIASLECKAMIVSMSRPICVELDFNPRTPHQNRHLLPTAKGWTLVSANTFRDHQPGKLDSRTRCGICRRRRSHESRRVVSRRAALFTTQTGPAAESPVEERRPQCDPDLLSQLL